MREMYLNIDAVAMHEPSTVDCALAAAAVLGSFIALHSPVTVGDQASLSGKSRLPVVQLRRYAFI